MPTEDPTLPGAKPPALVPISGTSLRVSDHMLGMHQRDRAEIRALADMIGVTPLLTTDLMNQIRISNGSGKGLWANASAAIGPSPIVNGGFELWSEATSFSSVADGTWLADGWVYAKAGAGVHDCLRSTDVPTVAQAEHVNYSLHLDVTTADASIAAGDIYAVGTRIEGYQWQRFDQKLFTLRFWAKAAKTGRHYVAARNAGNDRSCVMPYDVTAADTWEEKQVSFPASPGPAAGTWNYTNGRGIDLSWCLAGGSTFQTGAGVWATGNFFCGSDQVNEMDSAANNFRIALVGRPTVGAYAMPYVSEDYGQALERAQRYLQVFGGEVNVEVFANGFASSTTFGLFQMDLSAPMRAIPTATFTTAADFGISRQGGGLVAVNSGPSLQTGSSTQKALIRADVAAGLTAGEACRLVANSTTNARIKLLSRIP